ncbi:MAG: DUF296 domain-containing protein [Candidatus Woesearchaeota archaeon]
MKSKKTSNGYLIRLKKGEEIISALTDFCEENFISGASIKGIGGISECEIAYFSIKKCAYIPQNIKPNEKGEIFELLNLQGNITLLDSKVFVHAHIIIGDKDMKTFGGHLFKAIINPTCEIFLEEVKDEDGNRMMLNRKKDKETGLNLIDL